MLIRGDDIGCRILEFHRTEMASISIYSLESNECKRTLTRRSRHWLQALLR